MEDCQRVLTEEYGMERFDVIDVCLLSCVNRQSHMILTIVT